jgi:hypothetical protein
MDSVSTPRSRRPRRVTIQIRPSWTVTGGGPPVANLSYADALAYARHRAHEIGRHAMVVTRRRRPGRARGTS